LLRAEITLLIVCGTIPTLKPLYNFVLGNKKSTSMSGAYKLSTVSAARIPSRDNTQVEFKGGFATPPQGIAVTTTFETSSRVGSEEYIFPFKAQQ
jgi:hypothetical protein